MNEIYANIGEIVCFNEDGIIEITCKPDQKIIDNRSIEIIDSIPTIVCLKRSNDKIFYTINKFPRSRFIVLHYPEKAGEEFVVHKQGDPDEVNLTLYFDEMGYIALFIPMDHILVSKDIGIL